MKMFELDNSFDRYMVIQLAALAKQYQEPYDNHDEPARRNNEPLEQKWNALNDILMDKWNGAF